MKKRLFLSGICFVFFGALSAQDTGNKQWLQYYNDWQINSKWSVLTDASYRWNGGFEEKSQYLVRAGAGYQIAPKLRTAVGLAISRRYQNDAGTFEFRPYQEAQYSLSFPKWNFSQRLRIEERFFNPVFDGSLQTPNTFNWRFRYAITGSIPLLALSTKHPEKKLLLILGDEIMFNAGSGKGRKPFDQNRLLISPTLVLTNQLSISFTWMQLNTHNIANSAYNDSQVFWLQIRQRIGHKYSKS